MATGNKKKTLDQCFEELIQKRAWFTGSGYDRRLAFQDKQQFLSGKLKDERKREYLRAAGYVIVQQELWELKNNKDD